MKTVKTLATKIQSARKYALPVIFVLSSLSANAMAMGRNNAPCTLGDDCAATIYYHICNGWCFWY